MRLDGTEQTDLLEGSGVSTNVEHYRGEIWWQAGDDRHTRSLHTGKVSGSEDWWETSYGKEAVFFLEEEQANLVYKVGWNYHRKHNIFEHEYTHGIHDHLFYESHNQSDMLVIGSYFIARMQMLPNLKPPSPDIFNLPLGNLSSIRTAAYDRAAEKIYFQGDMSNDDNDVWWSINAIDGSELRQLTFVPGNPDVRSPLIVDGTMYYSDGDNRLWSIDPSTIGIFSGFDPTLVCSECAGDILIYDEDPFYTRGDFDLDFDVDITDFNTLATNFDPLGLNRSLWADGDVDADFDIDISDFSIFAAHFAPDGYDGLTTTGDSEATATPEPGTVVLMIAGLLLCLKQRSHHSARDVSRT